MPRPVWFEIPADDLPRAVQFYHSAFGWEITPLEGWPEYWIAKTPMSPNAVMGGAIMSRSAGACTRNTVAVTSLDETVAKVGQAGGKTISERMPIPHGTFVVCADPEGTEFGLIQPEMDEAPPPLEPGPLAMLTVIHFEIPADDVERAIAFYEGVFGWKIAKWDGPMDYWLADTGPDTECGMHGAIARRAAGPCPIDTISVPDVDEYVGKITGAGGAITMAKAEIPGVGWFVGCQDTEGNAFGIMQPL